MSLSPNTTLADARIWVEQGRKKQKGVKCPCCDQQVKLYKYTFNSIMGASIVWLSVACSRSPDGWVHVPTKAPPFIIRGRVFDKLKRWGLAVDQISEDGVKRRSGTWKTTTIGDDFANSRILVPDHAFLFNGKVEGFSTTNVDIMTVLKKDFNYAAMMAEKIP